MGQTTINNSDTGLVSRNAINDNFTELYASGVADIPIWQLSNIMQGLQRIPAFFRRLDSDNPSSGGSMKSNFVIASGPDLHIQWDALTRAETFIELIKYDKRKSNFYPDDPEPMVHAMVVQGDLLAASAADKQDIKDQYDILSGIGDGYVVDLLPGLGNHDNNSSVSNAVDTVMSKAELRVSLIDPIISSVDDIVAGAGSACYYYKDYLQYDPGPETSGQFKVRVIMLDELDVSEVIDGADYEYSQNSKRNYSQAQLTWLAETALNLPDVDWHVMILGHYRLQKESDYNTSKTALHNIIDAFAQQGTVVMNDTTTDFEFSLNVDFSSINGFDGAFIGYFYGHDHIPIISKLTINGTEYNNIEIPSLQPSAAGYNRQKETGTADIFTFIVVNPDDREIKLIRYGASTDITGSELPYGDYGIDPLITY